MVCLRTMETPKISENALKTTAKNRTHGVLDQLKYLGLFLLFLLSSYQTVCAWNLELGIHQLMPKLSSGEQRYINASGTDLRFKPVIEQTIIGQSANIGFVYENFSFHLEQAFYGYETTIPAENAAVIVDTAAEIEIKEQRVGLNYHLERELAGVFAGFGMTHEEERITIDGDEWIYEEDVPFLKLGIDMILGMWRVRIEQIHYSFGEHTVKVSSFGILLYL